MPITKEQTKSSRIATALTLCLLVCGQSAFGQELERRDTVVERQRPGFDADGLNVGGLNILPTLGAELRFIDNIFADDELEVDDTAFTLSPELSLNSRSERHRAQVGANADLARYSDRDSEDYDDARLWALADMQLGAGEIEGELRLSQLHQERTSPDDLGCARIAQQIICTGLTEYGRNRAGIAYTWSPNRLLLRADLRYTTLDFDDTDLPVGGSISNDDRDRSRSDLGLRVGYGLSADYALYLETRFDSIDFDQREDRDGFRRSSEGSEVRLGMLLDFTGKTFGEFYLGYLERDYDDIRFENASGPTFGADVSWNVTRLTTLRIEGERTIDNTIVLGAAGINRSRLTFGADHELLRSLIVSADLSFGNEDFEGLDRSDDLTEFSLGGKYLMNRYMQVLFGYRYRDRDTQPLNSGGRIFEINEIFVRVVGQL